MVTINGQNVFKAENLDRFHTCNFVVQLCLATLSRDKIASVTCGVEQLFNSPATPFPNRVALCSVQLYRENAVNVDWSILVYATKLQCAYCNFIERQVARQNRAIKLQV